LRLRFVRGLILALAIGGSTPAIARAEWQLKPFFGVTFDASTTLLLDPELISAGLPAKFGFGVNAAVLGEVLGVDVDFGVMPGFFSNSSFVTSSWVTTLTGNVIVALPRKVARYSLRPYFVAGAGVMHPYVNYVLFPDVANNLGTFDIGGGATGFLTQRIGLNWEVRHFSSFGGNVIPNFTGGQDEQLSFWRVTMAIAIR
jgi:hypothetical protein